MSDRDIRRPRRIIASEENQQHQLPVHTMNQADRFQRALSGRRLENTIRPATQTKQTTQQRDPRTMASHLGASTGHTVSTLTSTSTSTPVKQNSSNASTGTQAKKENPAEVVLSTKSFTPPPIQTASILSQETSFGQSFEPQHSERIGRDFRSIKGMSSTSFGQGWDSDLVHLIVTLCKRSDPNFEAWSIMVPVNQEVLPETELHLNLSSIQLLLRFHTQSPYSVRVISEHQETLHSMLKKALPFNREIEIEIT